MKHPKPIAEPAAVKSATRVLDILDHLGRWGSDSTHAEISDRLGIPKSSMTHLLRTMTNRGYLHYDAETKRYGLGQAISDLSQNERFHGDLIQSAIRVLKVVTTETGESSALNLLRGDKSEVVACIMSGHRLMYHMQLGDQAPLYATSGGKALLAFLTPEQQEQYYASVKIESFTQNTITTLPDLRSEVAKVRLAGVARVTEEFTLGISGVARPILDENGIAIASLNIAAPSFRLGSREIKRAETVLENAVADIREMIGIKRAREGLKYV